MCKENKAGGGIPREETSFLSRKSKALGCLTQYFKSLSL
ncbi:hypothetical protein AB751O23_AY_00030 [Chlamydiales bacterium SCGC AB-751-O23]|nr:hypothetical protein AB751O23_AY_00030 [Chlamydiales bacterium SCGC AB-751-O23]